MNHFLWSNYICYKGRFFGQSVILVATTWGPQWELYWELLGEPMGYIKNKLGTWWKNQIPKIISDPLLFTHNFIYFKIMLFYFILKFEMWWIRFIFSWKIFLKGWNWIFLVEKWKYCKKKKNIATPFRPMPSSNNLTTSREEPGVFRGCLTERNSRAFCIKESGRFHVR